MQQNTVQGFALRRKVAKPWVGKEQLGDSIKGKQVSLVAVEIIKCHPCSPPHSTADPAEVNPEWWSFSPDKGSSDADKNGTSMSARNIRSSGSQPEHDACHIGESFSSPGHRR